jgi:glyceraldehyde-3-phosphate dehydrogenase (NADP+)
VNGEIRTFTKKSQPIATAIYAGGDKDTAMDALAAAQRAWDRGLGTWPTMSIQGRVKAMHGFLQDYKAGKQQMAELLMWDICKSAKDANDEIDRTIGKLRD